jgi:hypothetical protein
MALNIDGTTGISGVNGSASAASIAGTDANTGLSFASDTVNINTGGVTRATIDSAGALDVPSNFPIKVNGSEKLRIDSSGNVGIGTTSPDHGRLTLSQSASSAFNALVIQQGNTGSSATDGLHIGIDSNVDAYIFHKESRALEFGTANTERMRITSSGGLMINDDGSTRIGEPKLHVLNGGSSNNVASFFFNTTHDRDAVIIRHNGCGTQSSTMINFLNEFGNQAGKIESDTNSTAYLTSSDYRLKENEVLISDGITRLKTLKPYRFNFKDTPLKTVDGFLAHEVTAVPESISGTKDETEDILYTEEDTIPSGKKVGDVKETVPKYQGIDQSKLVPLLTAALQEAIAKIEILETKVAALEAG